MVRISDARMSGTSYGACVLHVAPESHVGRSARARPRRRRDRARRGGAAGSRSLSPTRSWRSAGRDWQQPAAKYARGYGALYLQHITQANEGCDFDFLEAGAPTPEPEIH